MGVRFGAAALLLGLVIAARIEAGSSDPARRSGTGRGAPASDGDRGFGGTKSPDVHEVQKTTKDKLYSKEQATRGGEQYVKYCEKCHTPEKVPEGKKPGPQIVGPKFLDNWADRPLGELFNTILTTMPSDGSAVLTADQALDAVAYILQANGFPDGPAPLKNDDAMKTAIIVK